MVFSIICERCVLMTLRPMASPGFVASRGKDGNIMSWGTQGGLQGRLQQLLGD